MSELGIWFKKKIKQFLFEDFETRSFFFFEARARKINTKPVKIKNARGKSKNSLSYRTTYFCAKLSRCTHGLRCATEGNMPATPLFSKTSSTTECAVYLLLRLG
jgi:hypothetical protein